MADTLGADDIPPGATGSGTATTMDQALAWISRRAPLLIGLVTLGGAVLRLYDLGDKSLWFDEANLFWISHGSVAEIVEHNVLGNSAPPLFALLLALVIRVGTSEIALRALACVAGIALIPAVYLLARRYVERPWALAAAVLVTLSPTQVTYSQQLREYSLAALMATLLVWATQAFLDRRGTRQAVTLAGISVIALFTQYGLALVVLALAVTSAVWLIVTRQPFTVWRRWILAQTVAGASAATLVPLGLARQLADGKGGVTRTIRYLASGYWDRDLQTAWAFVIDRSDGLARFTYPSVLFAFLLLTGILSALRDRTTRWHLALLLAPVAVFVAAALVHAYPYGGIRQNIVLTPMLYVVAAIGGAAIGTTSSRWQPVAALAVLLAALGLRGIRSFYVSDGMEPLRPLIAEHVARRAPGDALYVSSRAIPAFRYYTRASSLEWIAGVQVRSRDSSAAIVQLDSLLQQHRRLWLLFSDDHYERGDVLLKRITPSDRLTTVESRQSAALYLVN